MKSSPLVSIIIPVYNTEIYISKCINSILDQTYKNIEVILIDDGSTDVSIKVIESFKDDRIKVIKQKNKGAAIARNNGLKEANGEYIFFVDSDDYLDLNCLEDMVATAKKNKSEYVSCDYYKCYEQDNYIQHVPLIPKELKHFKNCEVLGMPGPVCKLIKKNVFIKNNIEFPKGIIFEDNAIMPFVAAISKNKVHINKPYYYYLQREGSSLNKREYSKTFEDIFESLELLSKHFKVSNKYDEYKSEIEYIYIEYLIHAAGLKFINYKESYYNFDKINEVIKNNFPKWLKNKYFLKMNFKYKLVCYLIYTKRINLLKILLRK